MQKTIKLQSIGNVPAIEAGDLQIGDVTVWNFGGKEKILSVVSSTACFVTYEIQCMESGEIMERKLKKSRLVGYVTSPVIEAEAEQAIIDHLIENANEGDEVTAFKVNANLRFSHSETMHHIKRAFKRIVARGDLLVISRKHKEKTINGFTLNDVYKLTSMINDLKADKEALKAQYNKPLEEQINDHVSELDKTIADLEQQLNADFNRDIESALFEARQERADLLTPCKAVERWSRESFDTANIEPEDIKEGDLLSDWGFIGKVETIEIHQKENDKPVYCVGLSYVCGDLSNFLFLRQQINNGYGRSHLAGLQGNNRRNWKLIKPKK